MKIFRSKLFWILIAIFASLWLLSLDYSGNNSPTITYGASFSRLHSEELGLDWKETYLAMLNDLGVKNFRFSAHWPLTEPAEGRFNFNELDFQIKEAERENASFILAVGRRLPGWPECHDPDWVKGKDIESRNSELLKYVEAVVNRYKNSPSLKYWQVENEPFLAFFSRSACGELDKDFLEKEIELVRSLDPDHKILVTDSGEFGMWYSAYDQGDVFGTSLYLYIWWSDPFGPFRYPITPAFFRIKRNLVRFFEGEKDSMIIELSTEPWLRQPIIEAPFDVQQDRMSFDKFKEMISFSAETNFKDIYLWGAEWWYWMKVKHSHPEYWDTARLLFKE